MRIPPALLSLPVFIVEQLVAELCEIPKRSVYRGVHALKEARAVEVVSERGRCRDRVALKASPVSAA